MASVGNALEGRKLDLTAAKVLKFGLLKMTNAFCVCDDQLARGRLTCNGVWPPPVPARRPQGGRSAQR